MLILLIVLGALLLLVLLLLLIPLRVRVSYEQELSVKLYVLFFPVRVYPVKKKPKSGKDTGAARHKQKEQKPDSLKALIKRDGYADTFRGLAARIRPLLVHFRQVLSHIKVRPFRLSFLMTGDDPAALAVEYGAVCALAYPALSGLYRLMKFRRTETNLSVDYEKKEPRLHFFAIFRVCPVFLLTGGISLLLDFFKLRDYLDSADNTVQPERKNENE